MLRRGRSARSGMVLKRRERADYSLGMGVKGAGGLVVEAEAGGGELALLGQIRVRAAGSWSGVRLGIGDDCALLRLGKDEEAAVTTDLSIAGRHFRLNWHPAEAVGHRALARGLSDLAAMGARPVAAFLSLGLPRDLTADGGGSGGWAGVKDWAEAAKAKRGGTKRPKFEKNSWFSRFFDGFLALAERQKTPLAGGDLAESPVAVADVALVGAVRRGKALLRSGARAGDLLYVTGALGGGAAGLAHLAVGRELGKHEAAVMARYFYPQPRIAQGVWLARRGLASAAIDLSDGLSTDLAHLCEESDAAAELDAALLPVCPGASLEQALHGGDDYELLFAAPAEARVPRSIGGVAVTRIGRVVRRRRGRARVSIATERGVEALERRGWEHFSDLQEG